MDYSDKNQSTTQNAEDCHCKIEVINEDNSIEEQINRRPTHTKMCGNERNDINEVIDPVAEKNCNQEDGHSHQSLFEMSQQPSEYCFPDNVIYDDEMFSSDLEDDSSFQTPSNELTSVMYSDTDQPEKDRQHVLCVLKAEDELVTPTPHGGCEPILDTSDAVKPVTSSGSKEWNTCMQYFKSRDRFKDDENSQTDDPHDGEDTHYREYYSVDDDRLPINQNDSTPTSCDGGSEITSSPRNQPLHFTQYLLSGVHEYLMPIAAHCQPCTSSSSTNKFTNGDIGVVKNLINEEFPSTKMKEQTFQCKTEQCEDPITSVVNQQDEPDVNKNALTPPPASALPPVPARWLEDIAMSLTKMLDSCNQMIPVCSSDDPIKSCRPTEDKILTATPTPPLPAEILSVDESWYFGGKPPEDDTMDDEVSSQNPTDSESVELTSAFLPVRPVLCDPKKLFQVQCISEDELRSTYMPADENGQICIDNVSHNSTNLQQRKDNTESKNDFDTCATQDIGTTSENICEYLTCLSLEKESRNVKVNPIIQTNKPMKSFNIKTVVPQICLSDKSKLSEETEQQSIGNALWIRQTFVNPMIEQINENNTAYSDLQWDEIISCEPQTTTDEIDSDTETAEVRSTNVYKSIKVLSSEKLQCVGHKNEKGLYIDDVTAVVSGVKTTIENKMNRQNFGQSGTPENSRLFRDDSEIDDHQNFNKLYVSLPESDQLLRREFSDTADFFILEADSSCSKNKKVKLISSIHSSDQCLQKSIDVTNHRSFNIGLHQPEDSGGKSAKDPIRMLDCYPPSEQNVTTMHSKCDERKTHGLIKSEESTSETKATTSSTSTSTQWEALSIEGHHQLGAKSDMVLEIHSMPDSMNGSVHNVSYLPRSVSTSDPNSNYSMKSLTDESMEDVLIVKKRHESLKPNTSNLGNAPPSLNNDSGNTSPSMSNYRGNASHNISNDNIYNEVVTSGEGIHLSQNCLTSEQEMNLLYDAIQDIPAPLTRENNEYAPMEEEMYFEEQMIRAIPKNNSHNIVTIYDQNNDDEGDDGLLPIATGFDPDWVERQPINFLNAQQNNKHEQETTEAAENSAGELLRRSLSLIETAESDHSAALQDLREATDVRRQIILAASNLDMLHEESESTRSAADWHRCQLHRVEMECDVLKLEAENILGSLSDIKKPQKS